MLPLDIEWGGLTLLSLINILWDILKSIYADKAHKNKRNQMKTIFTENFGH